MNTIDIEQEKQYDFTFQGMQLYTHVSPYGVEEIYYTYPDTNIPVVIGYLLRYVITKEPWLLTFHHEIIGNYINYTQIYQYRFYNEEWMLIHFKVENENRLSQEDTIALYNLQDHLDGIYPGVNHWLNLNEDAEVIPTIQPWIGETSILK